MKGKNRKKSLALVVSLALVLTVGVGATLAYLAASSGPLANIFKPSKVTTGVEEDVTSETGVKKDVRIQNTGDTEAWIRAAVVVTWQTEGGDVYGQKPEAGTNYTNWDLGAGWVLAEDGFYYYTMPVAANSTTATALIDKISQVGDPPADGYYLTVEIIGSGIQSKPASVFNTEWKSSGLEVVVEDDKGNDLAPEQWYLKEVSDNG